MSSNLQKVEKFVKGSGNKKYTAIMRDGSKVHFGDSRYQHYKDNVPKSMGGGIWKSKDHGDTIRRKSYRSRHSGVKTKTGKNAYKVKYSPSWFSYHYLW